MDEPDLPRLSHSAIIAAQTPPPRPRPSFFLTRKRTHAEVYDADPFPTTSSDPALFSSDEQAPGAENYAPDVGRRKKRTYKGSWWDRHPLKQGSRKSARGQKREFTRNFDSGIFMGSQDESCSEEPLSSDSFTLEDELLRDQAAQQHQHQHQHEQTQNTNGPNSFRLWAQETHNQEYNETNDHIPSDSISPRTKLGPKPIGKRSREHSEVCAIVARCLDRGKEDVDLSSLSLTTLPDEVTSLQTLAKQDEIVPGMLDMGTDLEPQLRVYLASNLFTQFPTPVLELRNLRVLSLRNNNLTSMPPGIRELVNLESLNIAGNQLTELPFEVLELARFHKLAEVISSPNPWTDPGVADWGDQTADEHEMRCVRTTVLKDLQQWLVSKVSKPSLGGQRTDSYARVSSLSETVLRQLARLDPQNKVDFQSLMPPGTSEMVLERLQTLQEHPGRRCGYCRRLIVMAANERLEWWSISLRGRQLGEILPYRRLECAQGCGKKNDRAFRGNWNTQVLDMKFTVPRWPTLSSPCFNWPRPFLK
ncbi:hypothetical protein LTR96_000431 [Exophiala xenobiotica]|nr:hypothetical protein LTR96_000431 [Exophiala xenobiotica]KAK5337952.1 hypothetical protein LTR98_005801 [Exophiala xenobiotica]